MGVHSSLVRDLMSMHTDEPEEVRYGTVRTQEEEYEDEKRAFEEGTQKTKLPLFSFTYLVPFLK